MSDCCLCKSCECKPRNHEIEPARKAVCNSGILLVAAGSFITLLGLGFGGLPFLVTGGLAMWAFFESTKVKLAAYAHAGGVATESLFAMRTVASLGAERKFATTYATKLGYAARVAIYIAPATGFA